MTEPYKFGIAMWKKSTGSYCSHFQGLKPEERDYLIEALKADAPVRLIMYANEARSANSPDYTIRLFRPETEGQREDAI